MLWYATGEANTGATSYTGAGVYRLRHASRAHGFTDADRVGGDELESRSINQLRVDGVGNVYAATTRGLWKHSVSEHRHRAPWQLVFMPNPASDTDITKPYDNIINDVLIEPGTRGGVVLANAAWRSGAAYNGFYLSANGGQPGSFTRVSLTGEVNNADVGNAEFATAADGSKRYMVLEKLMASGSALLAFGDSYPVGIQAWYNNYVEVDPANPNHVYVGLEEIFETTDGGATGRLRGRTGTSRSRATTRRSRTPAARAPRTRTSTPSRSGEAPSSAATTAASTPVRSTRIAAPRTRSGTRPTGRTTTTACTTCSTTPSAWARTRSGAGSPSPAACRTTAVRCCAAARGRWSARSAATAVTSSSTGATAARSSTSTSSSRCG